jgi:hypothetical protein
MGAAVIWEGAVCGKEELPTRAQKPKGLSEVGGGVRDMLKNLSGKHKIEAARSEIWEATIRTESAINFGSAREVGANITHGIRKQTAVRRSSATVIEHMQRFVRAVTLQSMAQICKMEVKLIPRLRV